MKFNYGEYKGDESMKQEEKGGSMKEDNPTSDLSKFGMVELREGGKILTAYADRQLTDLANEHFSDDGVKLAFNTSSGYVFLTNEDYQVLMLNGDKLDLWVWLGYEGKEGFVEDLMCEYEDMHEEDKEEFEQYLTDEQKQKLGIEPPRDEDAIGGDLVDDKEYKEGDNE